MTIASPCLGVCHIEPASGLCLGCARSGDEIMQWGGAVEAFRTAVWAELPARRERLGIGVHRLAWTPDGIQAFIAWTLAPGRGTWVSGVHGAIAEFSIGAEDGLEVDVKGALLTAVTPLGALRFSLSPEVRAFGFGRTHPPGIVVLAVPGRVALAGRYGLVCRGPDAAALTAGGRAETLYDLGLGSAAAQFCIRTGLEDLQQALDAQLGQPWPKLLAAIGSAIVQASPSRVVRNAIGRIEVFSPIPPPGGVSPAGPHTHLLPVQLAVGGDLPPGLQIPAGFLPCAIHYPGPQPDNG